MCYNLSGSFYVVVFFVFDDLYFVDLVVIHLIFVLA